MFSEMIITETQRQSQLMRAIRISFGGEKRREKKNNLGNAIKKNKLFFIITVIK
jgi:hypothetical protein